MAKQKGLHQIKGKVGDMSYYQTAGVPGGLIRRIPEGLSSRVKTADEYANTRLNNDEFKNASGIAAFAFNAVPSRKSSMMRRFAVAEMIKEALQYIKDGSGNWGQRIPSATFDNIIVDLLENHSKGGPYSGEFGVISTMVGNNNTTEIHLAYDELDASRMRDLGFDGFYAIVVRGGCAEVVTDGFVRQIFGHNGPVPEDLVVTDGGADEVISTFSYSPQSFGLSPEGYTTATAAPNNGLFAIVTFTPYRLVGNQRHVLYEYSTFAAISLGQIPSA